MASGSFLDERSLEIIKSSQRQVGAWERVSSRPYPSLWPNSLNFYFVTCVTGPGQISPGGPLFPPPLPQQDKLLLPILSWPPPPPKPAPQVEKQTDK